MTRLFSEFVSQREADYCSSIQNVLMSRSLNHLATGFTTGSKLRPPLESEELALSVSVTTLIFKDPLIYRLRGDPVASLVLIHGKANTCSSCHLQFYN